MPQREKMDMMLREKKTCVGKKNTIDNFVKQMTNRGEMLIFMAELVFLKFKELLIRKR